MTFVFATLSLVFVFFPWIMKTYHLDSVYNGYVIISANLAGCVGCVVVGIFGKKFTYKRKCSILLFGQIVMYGAIWGSFELKKPELIIVSAAVFGFFCYPFLTTLTDMATQTTFPVG